MNKTPEINNAINHLFRQESGKMVAVLVKVFGAGHYQLAEDVVQDALLKAMETWKYKGVPDNPKAWLYQVARNKAIDIIRKQKHTQIFDFSDTEKQLLNSEYTLAATMEGFWQEQPMKNDFLAMMYACCHPALSPENQISFILKSLCGFSTREIAKAFLTTEDTISKRLYRTKCFFRKNKLIPQIPPLAQLPSRTQTVLNAIYLIFNEGYNSTHHDDLVRKDIISQALMLCKSLVESEQVQLPATFALMSLMCFHAARAASRVSGDGEMVLLPYQDRKKWDQDLIQSGINYLNRSATGKEVSVYHLEAAIAYEHCKAKDIHDTDWKVILRHYQTLFSLSPNPIVFLNLCIVVMEVDGPSKALEKLRAKDHQSLEKYYLYHAVLGEVYLRLGQKSKALHFLRKALALTHSVTEKTFLTKKMEYIATDNPL